MADLHIFNIILKNASEKSPNVCIGLVFSFRTYAITSTTYAVSASAQDDGLLQSSGDRFFSSSFVRVLYKGFFMRPSASNKYDDSIKSYLKSSSLL